MRGQCVVPYPQGTTCEGIGEVSIQADRNGRPSGVSLGTMGFYLTDSLTSGDVVKRECGRLSPSVPLTKGTKYWAVMTAPDGIGWNDWTDDPSEVLESIDDGEWKPAPNSKRLALRIDAGVDECVPDAKLLPTPGTTLGDLYVRTGGTVVNSWSMENQGLVPLTWSGYSITGADAQYFDVIPGPGAGDHFRFPRQIGVGGLQLGYISCLGGPQERWYRATVTFRTNDPDTPDLSIPVECMVDNTPPKVEYPVPTADGRNDWFIKPITVGVSAIDPEPSSLVRSTYCRRGGQEWQSPAAGLTATMTVEGVHDFACSASDRVGNTGTSAFTIFKLDTRPPVPQPVYEPAPTDDGWNNSSTSLHFDCQDPEPGSGVDQGATGGGVVLSETAGTNFTSAGCTDIAGHASTPVTSMVRIDMTKPVISVGSVTPAPNAAGWHRSDVTIGFDCGDTGVVQSGIKTDTVEDTVWRTETAGRTVASVGTCADKATNLAAVTTQFVKLDKTAPTTTIDDGPPQFTRSTDAELPFSGDDNLSGVAGYECRLDGGGFAPCSAPFRSSALPDGAHTLAVRAVDAAGNADTTPATRTWSVDTVEPDTAVTGPPAATSSRSASFTYSGDTRGGTAIARYECKLDDGQWGACQDYSGLDDRRHHFEVRAIDAAGNVDSSPAVHEWTVDTVAPDTAVAGPPAATSSRSASFTYSGDTLGGTAIARYECRLDGHSWDDCAPEYTGLADREHTLEVRAVDAAGNADGTPAVHEWTVDTVAPDTKIDDGPDPVTASRTAAFKYSGDAGAGTKVTDYECSLDHGTWGACGPYADLVAGKHTFEVRAVDAAGNEDESPAVSAWTVDLTAPTTTITEKPAARTPDRQARFTLAATDEGGSTVAGFECSLDSGAWADCPSSVQYTGLSDGRHTFAARAKDRVGNEEGPGVSYTWTVSGLVAVDDRATTLADTPLVIDVARNDLRPVQATLTADAASAEGGAVAVVSGGIRYAPPAGFTGTDSFGYAIEQNGDTSAAKVTVTVTRVQPTAKPPVAAPAAPIQANAAPTVTVARDGRCGRSQSGTFRLVIDNPDGSGVRVTASATSHRVGVVFGGRGGERTVAISRAPGLRRATVTLRVVDGPHVVKIPIGLAVGTRGDNRIRGTAGPDLLFGLGGDDRITGRGGDDLLCGGPGSDRLTGGAGNDVLIAGRGDDVLRGQAGNDVLRGDGGSDRMTGGAGDDVLRGGPRADVFRAAPGNDRLVDFDPERGDTQIR
jgi:hypothetical protein